MPASLSHAQSTIGTSAVQLTTSTQRCNDGVRVKALAGNSGTVYVGASGVTTSTGWPLTAGQEVLFPVQTANAIWAIASASSQVVAFFAE